MRPLPSTILGAMLALVLTGAAAAAPEDQVWLAGSDVYGRPFDLRSLRGQVVVLTFTSRYTQSEAHKINQALSMHAGGGLTVVTVVDLSGVPSLFHGYAKRRIADEEERGRVRHLLDEDGHIRSHFGVEPAHHVDIVIVDRDGALRGRFRGQGQLAAAEALIDQLSRTLAR
jgi:hypothetical protein